MIGKHGMLTTALLCLASLFGVQPSNGDHDCYCESKISWTHTDMAWSSDPYELCIQLTFNITRIDDDGCDPQDPWYRLKLFACDDCDEYLNPIFATEWTPVSVTGVYTSPWYCIAACPDLPSCWKVEMKDFNTTDNCLGPDQWPEHSNAGVIAKPPYSLCTSDLEALDCLFCGGTDELPGELLHFYKKKSDTLYMLPKDDMSGAAYGEAVNGLFKAPADGWLFVTVSKSPSDLAVDVWGSEEANGPGWQTASAREGSMIDPDRCLQMAGDDLFRFNVRTGKSCGQGTLSITFDWYQWNLDTCCYEHYQGVLKRDVRFLQYELVPADPLRPQRHVHKPTDHDDVIELRLPGCCGCLEEHKEQVGNFSHWFVAWPPGPSGEIREGFAKGWQIEGKILRSPGPDRVEYEFSR